MKSSFSELAGLAGSRERKMPDNELRHTPPAVQAGIPLRIYAFAAIYSLILISYLHPADSDIVDIFRVFGGQLPIDVVPPERRFLLENIIPNMIGVPILEIVKGRVGTIIVWFGLGLTLMLTVILYLYRRGELDWRLAFLIFTFSAGPKILISWIGKGDVYQLSLFLLIALAGPSGFFAALLSAAAVLCHPFIGLIALLSLECTRFMLHGRVNSWAVGGCISGFVLSQLVVRSLFGGEGGRAAYLSERLLDVLLSGTLGIGSFAIISLGLPLLIFLLSDVRLPDVARKQYAFRVVPFLGAVVGILLISGIAVYDHTRDFVLLTFPSYCLLLRHFRKEIITFFLARGPVAMLLSLLLLATPQYELGGWRAFSPFFAVKVADGLGVMSLKRRLQCQRACDSVGISDEGQFH